MQIPDCAERSAALAQLQSDGSDGFSHAAGLTFSLRDRPASEASVPVPQSLPPAGVEFGVAPFYIPCGPGRVLGAASAELDFSVQAPTTSKNLHRVLRALQVCSEAILFLFCFVSSHLLSSTFVLPLPPLSLRNSDSGLHI